MESTMRSVFSVFVSLAALLVACAAPSNDAAIRGRIYSATVTEELARDGYAPDIKDAAPYWTPSDQSLVCQ
jgi:hypothetical protein